jgi:hypothetical protein
MDDPSLLPNRIDGFFSGGIHGAAWYKNVGKMLSMPTSFDQRALPMTGTPGVP